MRKRKLKRTRKNCHQTAISYKLVLLLKLLVKYHVLISISTWLAEEPTDIQSSCRSYASVLIQAEGFTSLKLIETTYKELFSLIQHLNREILLY